MIVFQQAAQPLTALDFASIVSNFITSMDDLIVQPLMVSFSVVMVQILINSIS